MGINGLVNEYTQVTNAVRMRWPMGLGKYLLSKLEESMLKKGVLQVDKVEGKSGNFVFINGHAVGLSNKLNDFESLAVRMNKYETGLAKLTAKLRARLRSLSPRRRSSTPSPLSGRATKRSLQGNGSGCHWCILDHQHARGFLLQLLMRVCWCCVRRIRACVIKHVYSIK